MAPNLLPHLSHCKVSLSLSLSVLLSQIIYKITGNLEQFFLVSPSYFFYYLFVVLKLLGQELVIFSSCVGWSRKNTALSHLDPVDYLQHQHWSYREAAGSGTAWMNKALTEGEVFPHLLKT